MEVRERGVARGGDVQDWPPLDAGDQAMEVRVTASLVSTIWRNRRIAVPRNTAAKSLNSPKPEIAENLERDDSPGGKHYLGDVQCSFRRPYYC